jgi:hypothetical protein
VIVLEKIILYCRAEYIYVVCGFRLGDSNRDTLIVQVEEANEESANSEDKKDETPGTYKTRRQVYMTTSPVLYLQDIC